MSTTCDATWKDPPVHQHRCQLTVDHGGDACECACGVRTARVRFSAPDPVSIDAVAAGQTIAQTALEWRRGNDYEAAIIDDFLLSIGVDTDQTVAEFRSRLRTADDRAVLDAAGPLAQEHVVSTLEGRPIEAAVINTFLNAVARRVAAGGTVPADPPADPHRGMSFNTNPCNHSWPCEGSAIDHFCMWGRDHRLDFHKCQCSAVLPVAAPADPPANRCDVTACTEKATIRLVGEAGDIWLCNAHAQPNQPPADPPEAQP